MGSEVVDRRWACPNGSVEATVERRAAVDGEECRCLHRHRDSGSHRPGWAPDVSYSHGRRAAEHLVVDGAAEATSGETPTRRHRFTIAHELGHWVCHAHAAEEAAPAYCRSQDLSQDADRDLEREANVFGAELLMPQAAMREAWAAFPDTAEVAVRFDVSALAAQWRLYSFGLGERPA